MTVDFETLRIAFVAYRRREGITAARALIANYAPSANLGDVEDRAGLLAAFTGSAERNVVIGFTAISGEDES